MEWQKKVFLLRNSDELILTDMPREDVRSALKKLDYTRLCFVHERFRVWYYNFYFSPLSFSRSVFETVNLSVMTELHSSLIQWVCVRLSEPLSQWIFLAWERFAPLSISRWVFEPLNHLNQWMFLSFAPLSFSGSVCESVNLPTPLKLIWPKLELSTVEISKLCGGKKNLLSGAMIGLNES